mgnify:CR=1 FL=1
MNKLNSLLNRRKILSWGMVAPTVLSFTKTTYAASPFNFIKARAAYIERLLKIKRSGTLPIIDIESSYNPLNLSLGSFTRSMDKAGIALMCFSVDQPEKFVNQGQIWSDDALEAYEKYPEYFIPTGNGGTDPAWTRYPVKFLDLQEQFIQQHKYPMMGEFEVRHYPSPRQIERGEIYRDVNIPIDGHLMERVFKLSEKTNLPFQIHYEIEDQLLDPFARMLTKFPKAKVIWCHFAQIRYQQKSKRYNPSMLDNWLNKFPNLYIDTAFGNANSTYPLSGEKHARFWSNTKEWTDLIVSKPYRFLAALDIGGDRMNKVEDWTSNLREFLNILPQPARDIVAYKAAWRLLFKENLDI